MRVTLGVQEPIYAFIVARKLGKKLSVPPTSRDKLSAIPGMPGPGGRLVNFTARIQSFCLISLLQ